MEHAEFSSFVSKIQQRINQILDACLPITDGSAQHLFEAMRYSVLNGGKRVRPMLVYAAAEAVSTMGDNDNIGNVDCVAAAVELIHAYSLIHDDLPAMDNDELRRGKPTCHIAFDEATAILAGDALQSLAFEQLTQLTDIDAKIQVQLIQILTQAAGGQGMVAGQAIDINAVNQQPTLEHLTQMHRQKTGAMISASITMGALSADIANGLQMTALRDYGEALGLAFQVQDDILDLTSSTAVLGKTQGADQALNKPTFVSLLGLQSAKEKLHELHQQSLAALENFDQRADSLRAIADYIVHRNH